MALGVQVNELMAQGRVNRYPRHPFYVQHRPWEITPFFIAPVLPNETMKTMFMQSTAISDPVDSNLMGWHLEHTFFYVRHRDLTVNITTNTPLSDHLQQMMLDPAFTMNAGAKVGPVPNFYHGITAATTEWSPVRWCLQQIVQEYFREEGEAWNAYTISSANHPAAAIDRGRTGLNWTDSVTDDLNMPDGGAIEGSTVEQLDQLQTLYEQLMAAQLINMTYEDYLRSFGVRSQQIERVGRPEIIRELRNWTAPIYTVTQGTGAVTSSVKWDVNERADKSRFFPEPGWLFGVTVARPKVYLGNQLSSATTLMDTALSWLPAIFKDEVWSTLKLIPDTVGPLGTMSSAGGYWVDIRDLLLYGEQYLNVAPSTAGVNSVALPTADIANKRYASLTDAKNIFVDNTNGGYVKQDGLVSLVIAGTQKDWT